MRPRDKAVVVLMGGVLTYDCLCPPGETISEAVDGYEKRWPIGTVIFIGLTAAHLLNRLPVWADMYALFFKAVTRFVKGSLRARHENILG